MAGPLRIAIAGAGRMGRSIAREADGRADTDIVGIWSRGGDLANLARKADVIVDFSLPEATRQVLRAAVEAGKPLVCGVSGLDESGVTALKDSAATIPLVYDRNMSQGIALLDSVVRSMAGALGPEFSVSIAETHHDHKKDAPSGTALKLGETITGARPDAGDIEFSSERRGEVPGDHVVIFDSPTERLSFEHSVKTRDVFAAGALRAAHWVATGRSPGLYTMHHVLFGQ